VNHFLETAQLDKVSTPPKEKKIIHTLTPEHEIWIPQKGAGLEMSGREFPCQMSTTLGLRLEVWRMI